MAIPEGYFYKDGAYWNIDGSGPYGVDSAGVARLLGEAVQKSSMGVQRLALSMPLPPTDATGGAAKTYDVQIPAKRAFYGVRFMLMNLNTAAVANYTAMRCGSAPKHLLSYGDEITWWANLLTVAGSSGIVVPAATAAATADHVIPGIAITDFVPLQPVARTDRPVGKPLVRVRARCAAEVQKVYSVGGGFAPLWNAYVGLDGMVIGSYQASGDFATSAPTDHVYQITEGGGYAQPVTALFAYDDPGTQVWAFGDSLVQGNGSSVGSTAANGVLGWSTLMHLQQSTIDCLNMGVTGQKSEDSFAIARRMVAAADDLPSYVAVKVYSPNDGAPTQALIDAVWGRLLELCSYLRSRGIPTVLFTSPPVNSWTAGQHAFNEAQNTRAFALAVAWSGVKVVDMATAVSDPANRRQLLPAYNYGDGVHVLDAGHQAVCDAALPAFT